MSESAVRPRGLVAPQPAGAMTLAALVLASTVSWRPGAIYEGGIDPVVILKAMLSLVALGIAVLGRPRQQHPAPVSATPVWLLAAFLTTTMFGSLASGLTLVSAIIVGRVVILAVVAFLLVRTYGYARALECWLTSMAVVALVAALTGLPSLASGRLGGGVPAIHPNELAMLSVFPSIGLIWRFFQQRNRPIHYVVLVTLLGITYLTGSRTSLAGTLLAAVIIVALTRSLAPSRAIVTAMAAGVFAYVILGTTIVSSIFLRGGDQNVTSFASRSIGWSAAIDYATTDWARWLGSGIALREVPVEGQYWESQQMESSWLSALVQTGRVGVILLALWVLWMAWSIRLMPRPGRVVILAVFVVSIVRSVTESGLVDSTTVFVTFWLLSLACATHAAERWQRLAPQRLGTLRRAAGVPRPVHSGAGLADR